MANELGLRYVAFEVDDLQAAVDRLAADGYGLVGGIGQYERVWRMGHVRGPEGISVSPGRADRLTPAVVAARDSRLMHASVLLSCSVKELRIDGDEEVVAAP
jgi:hypothetical protein